jgi:hypothetical protein
MKKTEDLSALFGPAKPSEKGQGFDMFGGEEADEDKQVIV